MIKTITFLLSFAMAVQLSAASLSRPEVQWAKLVETQTASCQANSVSVASSNDVYWLFTLGSHEKALESYWGDEVLFSGTPYPESAGNSSSQDLALIKTDGDGNVRWVLHSLPGECMSNEGRVIATKDGGAVLSASIRHTSGFTDKSYTIIDGKGVSHDLGWVLEDSHRYVRVLLMKVDAQGGLLWYTMIDVDHSPAPAASGVYSEYTPVGVYSYGLALDDGENIYMTGSQKMDLYLKKADGTDVTIPCRNNKTYTGDSQQNVGDMYLIKFDNQGKYLKHIKTQGTAVKEALGGVCYSEGAIYIDGYIWGDGTSETFGGVQLNPSESFSPVVACLDTDLNVKWARCLQGEKVNNKHAYQNYSLTKAGDVMYLVGQYNLKISDPRSGKSVSSTQGNVREGFIIKLDAVTGDWISASNSRDSFTGTDGTGLTGYFRAFVNPSRPDKIYVFGYVMNATYGVFIRPYDANTLTADPDDAWYVIAKGGVPTCQVMAYDPSRGEAYITARGNQAFLPLGGELTETPRRKWDGGSCYACIATKFILPSEMTSSVDGVSVDDSDGNDPVEYYNIQGVRVDNPDKGFYIRRQGAKVEKVVMR